VIELNDKDTAAVTLKTTSLLNEVDSCHWLVKATCDVPEIALDPAYKGSSTNYALFVLEWNVAATKALNFNSIEDLPKAAAPTFIGD